MPVTYVAIAISICNFCEQTLVLTVDERAVDQGEEAIHLHANGWVAFGPVEHRVVACPLHRNSPAVEERKLQLAKAGGL